MRIFYRVEVEYSRAQSTEDGIWAGDISTDINFYDQEEMRQEIEDHTVWTSRRDTVLISAYRTKRRALSEAARRNRLDGERSARVIEFIPKLASEHIEYRRLDKIAQILGCDLTEMARLTADDEWVFLHHIPAETITRVYEDVESRGSGFDYVLVDY